MVSGVTFKSKANSLGLSDTKICQHDKSIGEKNRASVAKAVRAGVCTITPNGRRYFNPVELHVRHDTSGNAPTDSSMKLA